VVGVAFILGYFASGEFMLGDLCRVCIAAEGSMSDDECKCTLSY